MQVNFTGFKNTGYIQQEIHPVIVHDNKEYFVDDEFITVNTINTELNDDFNGKDLSEFKKFRNKIYKHPINPNFINIRTLKSEMEQDKGFYLIVNGAQVEINDDNLPLISFVAKLVKRIAEQNENKFSVNKDYLYNDDAPQSISLNEDLRDDFYLEHTGGYDEDAYKEYIESIHQPSTVKDGAETIMKQINTEMLNYFA